MPGMPAGVIGLEAVEFLVGDFWGVLHIIKVVVMVDEAAQLLDTRDRCFL